MGLLSFFQRKNDAAPSADAVDGVTLARTRARQRLVGAAVLVVIGVIGFPLIFETQPRPIPVDIPIEIPRKDNAAALVMPPARTAPAAPASAPVVSAVAVAPVEPVKAPAPVEPAETKPATKPEPKPEPKAEPKAEAKPTPPPADAARAKALLEDKPIAKAAPAAPADAAKPTGRFVVQAGAFTDAAAVSETRAKLDKIGLKSFTQPVETASGTRTRVRVGPFSSREEAEQALAKARAAGLSAVVLTL